jgi:hypothetical protein
VVNGTDGNKSVTISIVAGIYDWCITNPSPGDRVWIASGNGNVGGRQNDFTFEAGKHYTFTVTFDDGSSNDCVNMTVEDDIDLAQGDLTNVTGITSTSYNLSGLTASTHYTIFVQSVKGDKESDWSSVNFNTLNAGELYLYDNQDNTTVLANSVGQTVNVTLADRTLYKDGNWNTLCLPFNVTIADSPLAGADVRGLDNANITGSTLTLNFTAEGSVAEIVAGTPYIIKWTSGDDLVNPVFNGVTVKTGMNDFTSADRKVKFCGTYANRSFDDENRSILFLGLENTLYWPQAGARIGAQRAYFELDPSAAVRAFNLNFGDEDTGIEGIGQLDNLHSDNWYDLSGRKMSNGKLSNCQMKKGIYIHNGKKVVNK